MTPLGFSIDGDGVGWVILGGVAGRPPVLGKELLCGLRDLMGSAEARQAKAIVIASAHDRVFLAGADLAWLESLPDAAAASSVARLGLEAFARVESLGIPVVAALHGAAAGGGLELALACTWRIASEAPQTRIGLPEIGLGTVPGWGGTVRLPRLIGQGPALEHLLKAQRVPAPVALERGLVDELSPRTQLRERAKAAALRLAASGAPARPALHRLARAEFDAFRDKAGRLAAGTQSAALSAIDLVEEGGALRQEAAYQAETNVFSHLTAGATCKNLIRAFFLREAARKRTLEGWFESAPAASPPIGAVGVVGAGVMGSGLAHWLALHGHTVKLHDSQPDMLVRGLKVIRKLFEEGVTRGRLTAAEAAAGAARVAATSKWEGFSECDLVIEAVFEDAQIKREVFSEAARVVRPDALLASNSSALTIEEIAGHVPNPSRTLGLHFFNPVSRMSLAELVIGKETSAETAARGLAFLKALGKSPVICKSSPGLLVTRILFFYLNEAMRLWEQGVPTERLDSAMRSVGWPMGPLRLIDEVGLDVTEFICGEMARYFPERFEGSPAVGRLLLAGMRGRKNGSGSGFYRYEEGSEVPNDERTRATAGAALAAEADEPALARQLMGVMVAEAKRCLEEGIVKSEDDIDFALMTGAGFPAHHGGLLRYAQAGLPARRGRRALTPLPL